MRIRYLSSSVILLAGICCGMACRAGGHTYETAVVQAADAPVTLPNKDGSFKFCVLGDFGTAAKSQYELAEQMISLRGRFKYDFVMLVGDNLYGSERPQDFASKFETPYKRLLDGGVKFYASLGNHDAREQRFYKPFNMEGKLYYAFAPTPKISFWALDSTYPVPEQIQWIEKELATSTHEWKIVFFHHPLY
ncbi:MAG: metallophosphoesterase, partial [Acidobacteriota bacterium]